MPRPVDLNYWTPFLPDQRWQLDPEWQRALREAYKHNTARLTAYLEQNKKLTARHKKELAKLQNRRIGIRRGVKGRRHGRDPVHDKLYRLRTDIISVTQAGLQVMRQEHGKLLHDGIRAVLDPIFDFFIQAYDYNLTPAEKEQLKQDCEKEFRPKAI